MESTTLCTRSRRSVSAERSPTRSAQAKRRSGSLKSSVWSRSCSVSATVSPLTSLSQYLTRTASAPLALAPLRAWRTVQPPGVRARTSEPRTQPSPRASSQAPCCRAAVHSRQSSLKLPRALNGPDLACSWPGGLTACTASAASPACGPSGARRPTAARTSAASTSWRLLAGSRAPGASAQTSTRTGSRWISKQCQDCVRPVASWFCSSTRPSARSVQQFALACSCLPSGCRSVRSCRKPEGEASRTSEVTRAGSGKASPSATCRYWSQKLSKSRGARESETTLLQPGRLGESTPDRTTTVAQGCGSRPSSRHRPSSTSMSSWTLIGMPSSCPGCRSPGSQQVNSARSGLRRSFTSPRQSTLPSTQGSELTKLRHLLKV
mmetsp:Transcript_9300/g.29017  ORF Transcript_9300/g.29017 Transcript_9300/m.29017 type:complete len:379 (+) Transcript_9300:51-1187(+)